MVMRKPPARRLGAGATLAEVGPLRMAEIEGRSSRRLKL